MESVVANPLQFPVIHRQTHRALFRRFPYGLYYRIVDDQIDNLLAAKHRIQRANQPH